MFQQITDFFTPKYYHQDDGLMTQSKIVVNASLMTGIVVMCYTWYSFQTGYYSGGYALLMHAVLCLLNPLFLKKDVYGLKFAGWIYLLGGYAIVVASMAMSSGFHSMSTPWLCTLPIFAALLIDIRAGGIFTVISGVTLTLFWWFSIEETSNFFPNYIPEEHMPSWYLSSIIGAAVILYLVAYVFHQAQMKIIQTQEKQKKIIENQKEELEYSNQTKDRIFAILGHDLRKPAISFRGITKKVNFLLKKERYEQLNELGEEIESNAVRLNSMLDNLLHWALTQKGMGSNNPTKIAAVKIVQRIVETFRTTAKKKGIQLICEVGDGVELYADKNALTTIIRNLVDNALKYTEQGGRLTIIAEEQATMAKISIADTGLGISSEKLDRIFDLYQNKSERGTASEKGTGLGLHLVFELVRLNQGRIEVESALGLGTTFSVFLPKTASVVA